MLIQVIQWRLIKTGVAWKGRMERIQHKGEDSVLEYYPGEVVMDESETYICKKQHNKYFRSKTLRIDTDTLTGNDDFWTAHG